MDLTDGVEVVVAEEMTEYVRGYDQLGHRFRIGLTSYDLDQLPRRSTTGLGAES